MVYFSILAEGRRRTGADKQDFRWFEYQIISGARLLFIAVSDLAFLPLLNMLLTPLACDWWGKIIYRR